MCISESNESKTELVMQAISNFHNKTCIKFEPYDDSQTAFVVLTDIGSTGCVSFVGRLGTKQTVDLKVPGCDKVKVSSIIFYFFNEINMLILINALNRLAL